MVKACTVCRLKAKQFSLVLLSSPFSPFFFFLMFLRKKEEKMYKWYQYFFFFSQINPFLGKKKCYRADFYHKILLARSCLLLFQTYFLTVNTAFNL